MLRCAHVQNTEVDGAHVVYTFQPGERYGVDQRSRMMVRAEKDVWTLTHIVLWRSFALGLVTVSPVTSGRRAGAYRSPEKKPARAPRLALARLALRELL